MGTAQTLGPTLFVTEQRTEDLESMQELENAQAALEWLRKNDENSFKRIVRKGSSGQPLEDVENYFKTDKEKMKQQDQEFKVPDFYQLHNLISEGNSKDILRNK